MNYYYYYYFNVQTFFRIDISFMWMIKFIFNGTRTLLTWWSRTTPPVTKEEGCGDVETRVSQSWIQHSNFFFHSWPARIYSAVLMKFSSKCSWKMWSIIRWLLYCTTAQHTHTHTHTHAVLQRWKGLNSTPELRKTDLSYWKHFVADSYCCKRWHNQMLLQ